MSHRHTAHQILEDPDFLELSRRKNAISMVLTLLTIVVYYGFICLLAFKKELLGQKISSGVTLGIPIGIGVILLSWIFTGIYVRWANAQYDVLVEKVKTKIEDED